MRCGTASARKMAAPTESGTAMRMAMNEETQRAGDKDENAVIGAIRDREAADGDRVAVEIAQVPGDAGHEAEPVEADRRCRVDQQKQNHRAKRGGDQQAQAEKGEIGKAGFSWGHPLHETLPVCTGRGSQKVFT